MKESLSFDALHAREAGLTTHEDAVMPPIRFYFACLAGFITGAASALSTVAVQLSGTPEPIASMTWLTIAAAGLVAAVGAGKLAWPVAPTRP